MASSSMRTSRSRVPREVRHSRTNAPTGPLVIRGDSGAVAVRNIKYKSYTGAVKVSGLHYRVFEGAPMDSSYIATHTPVREGDASFVSANPANVQDQFALSYNGTLTVPTTGRYRFALSLGWIGNDSSTRGARLGGGKLTIDGMPVVVHTGADVAATPTRSSRRASIRSR